MEHWEIKDYITIVGLILTAGLGIWNLLVSRKNSKKTLFINTVTAARIKYIETVRNTISEFCALAYHFTITQLNNTQKQEIILSIDKLRYLIKLQLNRHEEIDRLIIEYVNLIPDLANPYKLNELENAISELVNLTQDLLKGEWEGVKKESTEGPLTSTQKQSVTGPYFNRVAND